jgi:hypothetical protein
MSQSDSPRDREADALVGLKARRDGRAVVVAELLRLGHDPKKVSAAVKIADAGGSLYEAMAALR